MEIILWFEKFGIKTLIQTKQKKLKLQQVYLYIVPRFQTIF